MIFDNFYVDVEVLVNGWNWVFQVNLNLWLEEMWLLNYFGCGVLYLVESNDLDFCVKEYDLYFWEYLLKNNISFCNYGFYIMFDKKGKVYGVDKKIFDLNIDYDFIGWSLDCLDLVRFFVLMVKNCGLKFCVDEWKFDFNKQFVKGSVLMVQLVCFGNDYIQVIKVGVLIFQVYVVDNDQVIG